MLKECWDTIGPIDAQVTVWVYSGSRKPANERKSCKLYNFYLVDMYSMGAVHLSHIALLSMSSSKFFLNLRYSADINFNTFYYCDFFFKKSSFVIIYMLHIM